MSKWKIIVIGPKESGKTLICNIIAEMSDSDYLRYEPTEGVRILEIEHSEKSNSQNKNIEIELWDCAGSLKFQPCWPVIQLDVRGIIFVYNPQQPEFISELELLYDYFIIQNSLTEANCMVFINQRENNSQEESLKIFPRRFSSVQKKVLNAAGNPNGVRQQFSNFIETLTKIMY